MKKWLTIGEIGKMFDLNVQTLHYYESIGLFVPESRDEENNYRIYRFDQIYKLASIRYLKKLGYSLKQIREYMDTRDLTHSLERLKAQSDQIIRQWEELVRVNDVIQRKVHYTEEKTKDLDTSSIRRESFPVRYYIPIGNEETLYSSNDFYFYPTVVFYRGDSKEFGALITRDGFDINCSQFPLEIQAGEYICAYHKGPYDNIYDTQARIKAFAENKGLNLDEESVNLNIIDQFVESDPEKYVTEVQIRLIRNSK